MLVVATVAPDDDLAPPLVCVRTFWVTDGPHMMGTPVPCAFSGTLVDLTPCARRGAQELLLLPLLPPTAIAFETFADFSTAGAEARGFRDRYSSAS